MRFQGFLEISSLGQLGSTTCCLETVLLKSARLKPACPNGFRALISICTSNWTSNGEVVESPVDLGDQVFGLIVGQMRIDVQRDLRVLVAGQYLHRLYIDACQQQIRDVGVAQLVRGHMEVDAVNNLAVVRGGFAEDRRNRVLDLLAVDVAGICSLLGGSDGNLLPESRPLGAGQRFTVPVGDYIVGLGFLLDVLQSGHELRRYRDCSL